MAHGNLLKKVEGEERKQLATEKHTVDQRNHSRRFNAEPSTAQTFKLPYTWSTQYHAELKTALFSTPEFLIWNKQKNAFDVTKWRVSYLSLMNDFTVS